jgi:hypothetical protein
MNPVSRRISGAVIALATLALAACAVPGQGNPGVAATYGDTVVTNQEVLDYDQAFVDLGTPAISTGVSVTLLLLGPTVISVAEEQGFTVTDDEAMIAAKAWMRHAGRDGTPTPDALEVVRAELALIQLLTTETGFAALEEITQGIEDDAVISPRHGTFTKERLDATLTDALEQVIRESLGSKRLIFVAFFRVDGLANELPLWISVG